MIQLRPLLNPGAVHAEKRREKAAGKTDSRTGREKATLPFNGEEKKKKDLLFAILGSLLES